MHRPDPNSDSGRSAAKPCKPTRALGGLHSVDHSPGSVRGDDHYAGRQYNQPIIKIIWNSHISLLIGKGCLAISSEAAGGSRANTRTEALQNFRACHGGLNCRIEKGTAPQLWYPLL